MSMVVKYSSDLRNAVSYDVCIPKNSIACDVLFAVNVVDFRIAQSNRIRTLRYLGMLRLFPIRENWTFY